MAYRNLSLGDFQGVKPLIKENGRWHYAALAYNVETQGGQLCRCKGFGRVLKGSLAGPEPIYRLHLYAKDGDLGSLVLRRDGVFCYNRREARRDCLWAMLSVAPFSDSFDFLPIELNGREKLLIAARGKAMKAFDPATEQLTDFGNPEGLSDISVNYLATYFGRLFAAGDPSHPARVYYSQLPGGRAADRQLGHSGRRRGCQRRLFGCRHRLLCHYGADGFKQPTADPKEQRPLPPAGG